MKWQATRPARNCFSRTGKSIVVCTRANNENTFHLVKIEGYSDGTLPGTVSRAASASRSIRWARKSRRAVKRAMQSSNGKQDQVSAAVLIAAKCLHGMLYEAGQYEKEVERV